MADVARMKSAVWYRRGVADSEENVSNELCIPLAARNAGHAEELLRAWAIDGQLHVVITYRLFNSSFSWGMLLVDVSKHIAGANRESSSDYDETLARIKEEFDQEWSQPTSPSLGLLEHPEDNRSDRLPIPSAASGAEYAGEFVRVWKIDGAQHVVISDALWENPPAWGPVLVDMAKHIAHAYSEQGADYQQTLGNIKHGFDVEWSNPTSETPGHMIDPKDERYDL